MILTDTSRLNLFGSLGSSFLVDRRQLDMCMKEFCYRRRTFVNEKGEQRSEEEMGKHKRCVYRILLDLDLFSY